MPDPLRAASFEPHLGEVFTMTVDDETRIDARLVEVKEAAWAFSPDKQRTPFSLFFQTQTQRVLGQRIYAIRHPALGELELFLVPTARNAEGVVYEAVFN